MVLTTVSGKRARIVALLVECHTEAYFKTAMPSCTRLPLVHHQESPLQDAVRVRVCYSTYGEMGRTIHSAVSTAPYPLKYQITTLTYGV